MTEIIDRIQNWYKLNCNGDWEHSYGYAISTLDNPGWTVRIDLEETALEGLNFKKDYQNQEKEHDWFTIKTRDRFLEFFCGPENLKDVFKIFFDEIIPNYSNQEFYYDLYLPLSGSNIKIWTPVKAQIVNEKYLRITDKEPVEYKRIKVRELEQIDFTQEDLDKMKIEFEIGEVVEVELEQVSDGVILIGKKKM